VWDCLIQFLLTVVPSIEERVFLVEYVFREGNRYNDLVQQQFAEKFPQTAVPYRNAVRRIIDKFLERGSALDARGHQFQHLLQVHSDFPKAQAVKPQKVSNALPLHCR
jgi:GH35 family endo-1,4-beta-xylanase